MSDIILKTNHLTKKYKEFKALDSVSITINKGDIYGLIGRNGAGKTTLMKIITTLTNPTSGEFELFGEGGSELTENKRRIGSLIENPSFFPNLTAYENLKYYAIQKGMVDFKPIEESLQLVGLVDARNKKFKNFSLGMKQRLGIAFAILDHPDFIILDEPINGLDPIGISDLRDTFKRLNEDQNITILISSHILSELYAVASRFCILEKGSVVKELSKEELDIECSKCVVIQTDNLKKTATILEKELNTTNYKVIDKKEIRLYEHLDQISKISKALSKNDINILGLYETGITLEEYFKYVIKEAN